MKSFEQLNHEFDERLFREEAENDREDPVELPEDEVDEGPLAEDREPG